MIACAVVTVTHNPALDVLQRQLDALGDAALVVVVDDASPMPTADAVRALTATLPRSAFVGLARNQGLAAGLNAGARRALEALPRCEFLLFLDQDTEPGAGGVAALIEAASALHRRDPRAGIVGPLMRDAATGLSHGFHVMRQLRWMRVHPRAGSREAVPCAAVNGSGMVVRADVFRALDGFDETLFIDHVDSEFSFRAARAGVHLYGVPAVSFTHRMGERSVRFWLGRWRVWPYRSPERHYYLFRNAATLMRRDYVPRVWKFWALVKLAATAVVHAFDPARGAQLRKMASGLQDGLRVRWVR